MPTKTSPPIVTVALVEDRRVIREGLDSLIDHTPGFRCSGSFGFMEEALPWIESAPPDVLLVDIGLPGRSAIEGIERIHRVRPDLPVLVLTVYDDDERIFEALQAGACGHLLKKTPPRDLLQSVRLVADGGALMSPDEAQRVLDAFAARSGSGVRGRPPSLEEARILEVLAEGHNYVTAAAETGSSPTVIASRVRRIYAKLQHGPDRSNGPDRSDPRGPRGRFRRSIGRAPAGGG